MTNPNWQKIAKFPKHRQYPEGSLEAYHDQVFGAGSWDEVKARVFKRHPEFAPGGIYGDKPKTILRRKWWEFWKAESNIISLGDYRS